MKSQKSCFSKWASVLVPVLLAMVVLPWGSLIAEDVFYRVAYGDGQMFYRWVCQLACYYGGRFDPDTGSVGYNPNFFDPVSGDPHYYYPEVDSAGFNTVWTQIMNSEDVYGDYGFRVWHGNTLDPYYQVVGRYGGSQCERFEVGDEYPPLYHGHNYFAVPHDPTAATSGPDDYVPSRPYVFMSIPSQHESGYPIDTTIHTQFRGLHDWHLQLIMRIDTVDTNPTDYVISVTFGTQGQISPEENAQLATPHLQIWAQEDSNSWAEGTDDCTTWTFWVADLLDSGDFAAGYDTLEIIKEDCNAWNTELYLRIYWSDEVAFYLDQIRIFDQEYHDFVEEPDADVVDLATAACGNTMSLDHLHGICVDEPYPIQYRGTAKVDSIINTDFPGKRFVPVLMPRDSSFFHEYYDFVSEITDPPPFLMTDKYTLEPDVLHESQTDNHSTFRTLQSAWDSLIIGTHRWGGPIEDDMIWGLRPLAELSRDLNVHWMMEISSSDWWQFNEQAETFNQWKREPTPNEILCQAWLSLSFGATGMPIFTAAPQYSRKPQFFEGHGTCLRLFLNDEDSSMGYVQHTGIFDFLTEDNEFPVPEDFPAVIHTGHFEPNAKYDSIMAFHRDLDLIESTLLDLSWVESFGTVYKGEITTNYGYIDSVWTDEDDSHGDEIDSTFVQVGVFCEPGHEEYKYLMLVNRRCIDDERLNEARTVHARLDMGVTNKRRCFQVKDYLADTEECYPSDQNGKMEFSTYLEAGHGKLFRIRGYSSTTVIDTNAVVDWVSGDIVFVVDTLEVRGTLIMHPGTQVKICDITDGILVKPGGHLAILGTADSMVTIEGVNPDSLNAHIKLYGEGTDTIQYCNISNLNWGVAVGDERTLALKNCNISHCNSGVVSVGDGTLYMDSCTVDSCNWEGIHLNEGDEGFIKNCTITHNGESGIRLNGVKSTFKVAYNSLEGNNANTDSIYEAIHLYYCSPEIFGNHIENNVQDGVGSYHDSYPVMNKDSETQGDALNRLVNNREWKIGHQKSSLDFA